MLVVFASPPGAASFSEEELKNEVRESTAKMSDRLSLKLLSYMVTLAYVRACNSDTTYRYRKA